MAIEAKSGPTKLAWLDWHPALSFLKNAMAAFTTSQALAMSSI